MTRTRRFFLALGGVTALTGLTGLVGGCAPSAPSASPARPAIASPTATPAQVSADNRACVGVQGVIGHLAADTARWAPQQRPFARPMAERIRMRAQELERQAPAAKSTQVRSAVRDAAGSFAALADAMEARKRTGVTEAIGATRVSYRVLKQVCALQ